MEKEKGKKWIDRAEKNEGFGSSNQYIRRVDQVRQQLNDVQ